MFRVVVRNAVSNWLGFLVQAAVTFLLTPFVLRVLGPSEYGLWMLVVGLTGYYGLLDLGFRAGLTQYLTRHLANRDYARMNATASTGLVVLAGFGAAILVAGLGVATAAPYLFNLPAESEGEVWWAIVINATAVMLQLPLFVYSAVFTAKQRYDLSNLIGTTTRLGTALGTYFCLSAGHGLVGLSLVVACGNLLDYAARCVVAYRILPELRVAPRQASWAAAREFMHFGLWNVVIAGSQQLLFYSSAILIGLFLSPADIAPYALGASLIVYFANLFTPFGMVFFPAATELDARNDTAGLRALYLNGGRVLLLLAVAVGIPAAFWAGDFFRLWLGGGGGPGVAETAAAVFHLLLVGAVCVASQRVSYQILLGTRRIQRLALLLGLEALANLTLTICLIPWLGLYGVALGSLVPAVVFQSLIHPWVVNRVLAIPARRYVASVWPRPLAVAVSLGGLLWLVRLLPPVSTWAELVFQGGLGGAAALATLVILGLDRAQRDHFVLGPLRRWMSRRFRHAAVQGELQEAAPPARRTEGQPVSG